MALFGLGQQKPHHYREMVRIVWENRDQLPFAWRILTRGVCDGCALGTTGVRDWTLPGTHLYKEVKDQMILRNFDYYDFVHSLLPMKLSAKEFYQEYIGLIDNTRSLSAKLAFLKKYPMRELPTLMKKGLTFYEQLKQLHKTYDRLDELNREQTPWGVEPTFGWSGTTGTLVKLQRGKGGKLLPIMHEAATDAE